MVAPGTAVYAAATGGPFGIAYAAVVFALIGLDKYLP